MKVLTIIIPGLHLGYLGCYGNDWIDTRSLDALAAEGVVFDQHFADCLTWPSCFTGRYRFPWRTESAEPPSADLPALLAQNNVAVHIVRPSAKAWEAGFTACLEDLFEQLQHTLNELLDDDDTLLWLEFPELLPPWSVPEEFLQHYFQNEHTDEEDEDFTEDAEADAPLLPLPDPPPEIGPEDLLLHERLQYTYAALVHFVDVFIGEAMVVLDEVGLLDEFAIVVTSNRGLALAEHGIVGDVRPWLHEEVTHLPLIVRLPRDEQAGRRVRTLTQPVDLFATMIDWFGISLPESQSKSLLPLLHGQTDAVRGYACAGWQIGTAEEWLLRTPEWALLLPGEGGEPRQPQLFSKPDDRWEVNDVRQRYFELAEKLEDFLRSVVDNICTGAPLPEMPENILEESETEE